ncbi:hypothetical protein Tco_0468640 [Tanacetum coccineum]
MRRARIVISEDEDAEEDSSNQGRKIFEIDKDPIISLVQPEQDMEYNLMRQKRDKDKEMAFMKRREFGSRRRQRSNLSKKDLGMKKLFDCKNRLMKKKTKGLLGMQKLPKNNYKKNMIEQDKNKKFKKRSKEDSDAEKQKLENDAEKKELRDSMDVVPRDDIAIDIESLATKYPIVDWKTD